VRAGLGFVGHNCLLIAPRLGSYLLIGEVVTTLELPPGRPIAARCGDCRACLDACPTSALVAPRTIDPRRCLAYLTIELREPIPPALREATSERLFGCDRCQEVCPHNGVDARPSLDPEPSRPLRRWSRLGLRDMVVLDEEGWTATARGTALCRVPAWVMARNALLVAWRLTQEDPIAARAALAAGRSHAHERVRELAAWLTARAG
jgi:epoxyqueuosine reductase